MEVGRKRGERISKGWMRRRVEKKMENNDQEKERKKKEKGKGKKTKRRGGSEHKTKKKMC